MRDFLRTSSGSKNEIVSQKIILSFNSQISDFLFDCLDCSGAKCWWLKCERRKDKQGYVIDTCTCRTHTCKHVRKLFDLWFRGCCEERLENEA